MNPLRLLVFAYSPNQYYYGSNVVVNGRVARQSVKRSWRGRNLPALELTVRDLGVDVQWAAR
eukprot:2370128-Amphidinium_carterae.1